MVANTQRSLEGLRLSEVARRAATVPWSPEALRLLRGRLKALRLFRGRRKGCDLPTIALLPQLLKFETHVEEQY